MTYEEKKQYFYEKMEAYTKQKVCIAFSGGVDSSVLLVAAKQCAEKNKEKQEIHAVTFDSMLHPACDLDFAEKAAKQAGVRHKVIFVNELAQEEIRWNPKNRCYLCKKALFEQLKEYAALVQAPFILEGTNEEDLHVYRPGIAAVRELGILSPLAEAGLSKADVRRLAEELHVLSAKRPSTPCLATRLPYGTEIKKEVLAQIADGEAYLREQGFPIVRLRLHGTTARIEIPQEQFLEFLEKKEAIAEQMKKRGFVYTALDIQGFRSGSMDEE